MRCNLWVLSIWDGFRSIRPWKGVTFAATLHGKLDEALVFTCLPPKNISQITVGNPAMCKKRCWCFGKYKWMDAFRVITELQHQKEVHGGSHVCNAPAGRCNVSYSWHVHDAGISLFCLAQEYPGPFFSASPAHRKHLTSINVFSGVPNIFWNTRSNLC